MQTTEVSGIKSYHFENLSSFDNIVHFVTSRKGGYSKGQFEGLNIGFNIGDNNWNVFRNRKLLSDALGIPLESFTFSGQCHSSNIAIIGNKLRGCGATDEKSSVQNFDSMITSLLNTCISIKVADCVPILLYDKEKHIAAALHAGWKGTINKIAEKTVEKLLDFCSSQARDIFAGIGPSIGPCCYEVGEDVYREYKFSGGTKKNIISPAKQQGKYYFDLWQANKEQLIEIGVKPEHIELASICTKCNNEDFFSSRATDGNTGRFAAGIMLKKQ